MNNQSFLEKTSYYIDKVVGYLCIVFGMAMTVTTLIGVLFRYIMTNPLPWTEELARYTMIWMGLLAISMGVKRQAHLGLQFIVELLPNTLQRLLKYAIRIVIGFFLYMLFIYGNKMAFDGFYQTSPALQIPMFYALFAVPVSAIVSLVQLVLITGIDIQKWIRSSRTVTTVEGRNV